MADAATLRDYALDNFDKNTAETRRSLNEYKKENNEKFGKGSAKEILDDLYSSDIFKASCAVC